MKSRILLIAILLTLYSCKENKSVENTAKSNEQIFESIKVERYTVKGGNLDSIFFSSYIMRTFDSEGKEAKSVYFSTDNSIMMQFINEYKGNNKTKINWVNAQDILVKYVKNTYNEDDRLIRSESFSPKN